MTVEELKEQLTSSLPPLFRCDAIGENRFRVRTPLIFPDGGVVDVFVSKSDDRYTVTDYGDAMGWLDMRTATPGIAAKQRNLVADACRTHGIELKGGHVMLRSVDAKDLARVNHARRSSRGICRGRLVYDAAGNARCVPGH